MISAPPTPARPEETEAVTALLFAQLDEHAIPVDPERLAATVRAALADTEHVVLVTRVDGRPAGVAFLSLAWPLERAGRVLWLEELYVLPELRGRGLGTELLRAALEVARARGCVAVELEVERSHARAAHLYARAGFRPLERVHWMLPLPGFTG